MEAVEREAVNASLHGRSQAEVQELLAVGDPQPVLAALELAKGAESLPQLATGTNEAKADTRALQKALSPEKEALLLRLGELSLERLVTGALQAWRRNSASREGDEASQRSAGPQAASPPRRLVGTMHGSHRADLTTGEFRWLQVVNALQAAHDPDTQSQPQA